MAWRLGRAGSLDLGGRFAGLVVSGVERWDESFCWTGLVVVMEGRE